MSAPNTGLAALLFGIAYGLVVGFVVGHFIL